MEKQIILASQFRAKVVVGLIRGHKQPSLKEMKKLGSFAKKSGVELLVEPINRYEIGFINNSEEALRYVKLWGEPYKILLDTFHMNIEEKNIAEAFLQCKEYLGHVQFADSNRLAPGQGHIDFAGILQTLSKINYQGYLSKEMLPYPTFLEAAKRSYNYIKQIMEKYAA